MKRIAEETGNKFPNGWTEVAILAKAFRGELAPQDPNDEPASVLVERIKAGKMNVGTVTSKRTSRPKR